MILIADRNGQLGNRISTFAHFIGWGLEYGVRIANPGFRNYAQYFEGTFADPWCRYPAQSPSAIDALTRRIVYPLIFYAARHARRANIQTPWLATQNSRGDIFDLGSHTEELLAAKLTMVRGWQFRDDPNFQKYRDAICAHFTPRPVHLRRIGECIARARANCDILVGVHIRRGDYIKHLNGRYFYDPSVYRAFMERIGTVFENKSVGFLICSNEPVDGSKFNGLNFHFGTNHLVEDMYSFASCDYLIGPPSTYTIWASYYGKVPLFAITSPQANLQLANFEVH
jgi:Glycosyl transferase family 11